MRRHLTLSELRAIEARADGVAEDAADETVVALRRFLNRYVANIKATLADARTLRIGTQSVLTFEESAVIDLAEQEEIVAVIRQALNESGYGEVVDEFERALERVGTEAVQYFHDVFDTVPTFGGVNRESIRIMHTSFLDELDFQIDSKLVRPLESQVRNSMLTLKDRGEAIDDITRAINEGNILRRDGNQFTNVNIETLVHESNRRFMQHVRNEKADQLSLPIFIYSGPLDKVTSPQCRHLLTASPHGAPGVFYRDEITQSLHPNLPPNPLVSRGHYNCRHEWLPVDEAGAQRILPGFIPRSEQREAA